MKKETVIFTIFLLLAGSGAHCADTEFSGAAPIAVSHVKSDYSVCNDTFRATPENLLYVTLGALNKLNLNVKEVSSKTGTILFASAAGEFLVTIAKTDATHCFMKILPVDNNYSFSQEKKKNIFIAVRAGILSGQIKSFGS